MSGTNEPRLILRRDMELSSRRITHAALRLLEYNVHRSLNHADVVFVAHSGGLVAIRVLHRNNYPPRSTRTHHGTFNSV